MPIYEYECNGCGKTFEVFVGVKDKPIKKCTYCQSTKIKKLISNCSFQLKGTGWYVTDYGGKKETGSKKKEKKADSSESATKSDVKDVKDSGKAAEKTTNESKETTKAA